MQAKAKAQGWFPVTELANVARSKGFVDSFDATMQAKAKAQGWLPATELANFACSNGFMDLFDAPMQAKAQAQGWIPEPTVLNHTWTQERTNIAIANGFEPLINPIPAAAPTFNPQAVYPNGQRLFLANKSQSESPWHCQGSP